MNDYNYGKLTDALLFAIEKHQGQLRDDERPAVSHPIRVVEFLREILEVKDVDTLCAAYLHDTIEDTGTSYDEIARKFGDKIAGIVAELTNDKRLPKPQRKKDMIERAKGFSFQAKLIKLADRYDNVCDMKNWDQEEIIRYKKESSLLLQSLKGTNSKVEKMLSDVLNV